MRNYLNIIEDENKSVNNLLKEISKITVKNKSKMILNINKLLKFQKEFNNYKCEFLDDSINITCNPKLLENNKTCIYSINISDDILRDNKKRYFINNLGLIKKIDGISLEYSIVADYIHVSIAKKYTNGNRILFNADFDRNNKTRKEQSSQIYEENIDLVKIIFSGDSRFENESINNALLDYLLLGKELSIETNDIVELNTDIELKKYKNSIIRINILNLNESDNIENRLKI